MFQVHGVTCYYMLAKNCKPASFVEGRVRMHFVHVANNLSSRTFHCKKLLLFCSHGTIHSKMRNISIHVIHLFLEINNMFTMI